MTVRTRFAPSPTGELHLGNARIAVLNWLYARHTGGRFLLRIEDTDIDRNLPGAEEEILGSLRELGLDWDEGPDVGGEHGPYRQSERTKIYREYADRLLAGGSAYRCYCTPEELEARKQRQLKRGEPPGYDGRCRDLSQEEERRQQERGIVPSLRFKTPDDEVVVSDPVRGAITFDGSEFGDFVVMKSDGPPTYNFAVVVDDISMEISHVIRGAGHLANTPRQLMIYRALAAEPPVFVHVPHVLSPDGSPLAKRHGARSLQDYLDEGYHPDALINYLSLLSWSSPSGDEVLTPERLIGEIDLARIGTSDVRLDPDKLEWLSGEHIRRMGPEDLADKLIEHLGADALPDGPKGPAGVAAALRERITTFQEAEDYLPQLDPPRPMEWDHPALEALQGPEVVALLEAVRDALADLDEWTGEAAMAAVRAAGKSVGVRGRDLFMPVRAAVTGTTQGPELVDVFAVQGREVTLRVVEEAIGRLERGR
ncbi:MAG: glutamate--tRNA ligase [Gemmatimonadetes bacterium]|uniref:Glutamate--tRNA ligase n=1 Tax=Candidatus Kutchimonas denitrificans TaxID=3056748 RepID=A0AAE5CD86_9BACT|nr:glutamate--tRNA ligase [Gemmatimonadota bacterium]NIR75269.1 glutamate--tRNA ligase [Candidatus Kutchimonas denitrificans]NIS00207.1 glutamate--tRNA ligase [Gemmatimonadota bacterium]NIT65799.1 glutamate--tRNA ligase [Gemmatimonadota bacterium]NIU53077.1 glutamate--tRNA ligase [Gemmatimonadota bacterium]